VVEVRDLVKQRKIGGLSGNIRCDLIRFTDIEGDYYKMKQLTTCSNSTKKNKKPFFIIALTFLLTGTSACSTTAPVFVSGVVSDADGTPPAAAVIILLSTENYDTVANPVMTDEVGHYQFEVPGEQNYLQIVVPLSGETLEGYNLHGYTSQFSLISAGSDDVIRNFTLIPCHDFILESFDSDGVLFLNDDWIGLRFVDDTVGNATEDLFIGNDKGEGTPSVPGVCIPLDQTRRFFIQQTIPSFGNIMLMADNEGEGYTASVQGGTVLNLSYELAHAQINRLRDNLDAYQFAGYKIPPSINDELVEAEFLLSQADSKTGAQQATLSDQATSKALWALENLELARAGQDIPRYRIGNLNMTVLDAAGVPLSGATVAYTQTSHDFLFGIFDTLENAGIEGYELMQQAGINYLTTGFYLSETEPEQDQVSWDYIDHQIGVLDLAEMGFTLKAHALLALWDFATPDYLKEMSFDEINIEVYEHISELVDRYRDQIEIWNVINEAHGRGAALDFSREEITTLTQTGIRAIRNQDPDARIIINNAFDWYGESRQMSLMTTGQADDFTLSVPAYLDQLIVDGVNYDIIGQQLYNGGYVSIFSDWGLGDPMGVNTWDLSHLSEFLDQLGKYGKPVHITEQSVPSTWDPDWAEYGAGWRHNHWDEEMQAEYLQDFYTLAFSKERVEAITWWCINDSNSFINTGGLLDEDNNPKQAYFTMRDLIDDWTTTGKSVTDPAGQISILGYGGEYDLTVTHGDQSWSGTVHIWEQQSNEFNIQIPGD